ncbi:DNA translocase FtsK [Prevotella sp. PINT]|jgi:DNA segregation ATPase FtsK/SpoIIIE and related proteins|uniref:FtsK/SpoIIIE family DNA translocase n=1 Tax=Palleniella intestinalis TaxID=2736291 RepID=UPI0015564971|nr:DNA translocase FtsK [Palleniella intestinalis]NPD80784.1 DNA translocase FtsK [Palleniella intestinalis]
MSTVKNNNKKAAKSGKKVKKTYADVMGIGSVVHNEKVDFVVGLVLLGLAILMMISMVSYFFTGAYDQSLVIQLRPGELISSYDSFQNVCGSFGALVSYFLVARWFGIAAFFIPVFIMFCGLQLMGAYKVNLWKWFFSTALTMVWMSVTFAKFLTPIMTDQVFYPGGDHGENCRQFLEGVIGSPGLIVVLGIVAVAFLTFLTSETIAFIRHLLNPIGYITSKVKFSAEIGGGETEETWRNESTTYENPAAQTVSFNEGVATFDQPDNTEDTANRTMVDEETGEIVLTDSEPESSGNISGKPEPETGKDVELVVETGAREEKARGKSLTHYDLSTPINPREPFTAYKFPTLNLLKKYDNDSKPYIDKEELIANKKRIVEVLNSFGVQIREIKATVGPTITLYEITPAEGVRISKIRNLEDDIALSLAALGIRIIAPIPGKGTIGIEVPNAKPAIVSMESILNSKKFQESTMELPIALGKTITNEVFMVDLAKQPHLLVAGATGQGKSVGLNAIITSLLYKKHPNELKIVLVDPKKVEFSVYGPIAEHFMASVDEDEDPIITDVTKVVRTLKSLCTLMDKRYDLLKVAGARNIKEYNQKFLSHKLNPEKGHEYMPYIVVIIDEFGDLIMTAGKEVELPIARIAQLARAVGIHMIIATQRPTTSIITGNIKANFPGRIAFRVGAIVDSRTILDRPGANQLVGRGDMLFLNGQEPTRVQCAFVDTPEVEDIANYIASQPGPLHPMELPEPATDEAGAGGVGDSSLADLDPLFEEVARFIVMSNQGSTSAIQRKFSIGYNRAGRLMDQIERLGIVGAAQGSKPREVLVTDENSLDTLIAQLRQ